MSGIEKFNFTPAEMAELGSLGVLALVLFGSRATGYARENSDFDIGVLVSSLSLIKDHAKRIKIYDRLYDILSGKIRQLVNVDIVFLQSAPGELKASVVKNGIVFYETQKNTFNNFKELEMQSYADFAPLRQIFTNAILERIS